mmetsp:Transcript_22667/g.58316  ORF Transcript_22667/g.58316 Transcript_22667/m.58316 type:complete len:129 (-) Transcript_22667:415-801(-)
MMTRTATTLLLALAALTAPVSAMFSHTHNSALLRRAAASQAANVLALGIGDVSGAYSSRIDFKRGRVCETGAFGKKVCRKVSQAALGVYDSLDQELAEVEDLPSFWILQAEEEFRREMSGSSPLDHYE